MSADSKRRLTAEDLYRFATVSDPHITPDGELIAFVRTHIDPDTRENRSAIWTATPGGGTPVQFTQGGKTDASPRWSPNGRTLAFISDRGGEKQIWLIDRFGGEARVLTAMRHGVSSLVWSPDGTRIAFTSPVGLDERRELLTRTRSDADKKAEEKRSRDEARVFTRMDWRSDPIGIRPPRRTQVFWVPVTASGAPLPAPVQVTWGEWDHQGPQWSPDGAFITFGAKRSDDQHRQFYDIFVTPVPAADAPGARAMLAPAATGIEEPKGDDADARAATLNAAAAEAEASFAPINVTGERGIFYAAAFSPDGETLAVIGHENEFANATQSSVYLFPVDRSGGALSFGEARKLDNWDLEIGQSIGADVRPGGNWTPTWAPDGNMLYVSVTERGTASVTGFPVVGGRPWLLVGGEREISAWCFDHNCETLAFVAGDMLNISDLYAMDCREFEERRLTHVNRDLFDRLALPEVEELSFKARDGLELHGWLMRPVGFEAGRQYPTVLEIHGGPHTCYGHAFMQEFQLLAANGYGVLFINPRGSTGYGQAFKNAVRGDYGNRDYNDLMDAVDHALTRGWVDAERLAVTGGSYGGFMTNWIVTQTDRFAAAISHRSISNWVSFAGTPDFGPFFNIMQHLVEDPWSAEGVEALWKISPLKYVKNVKTPISLMHSEFDYRCPIEQAEQFFMAIKFYRHAPTELIRHPRSNHDLTRQGPPALRVDRFHRILAWFGRYCPARGTEG